MAVKSFAEQYVKGVTPHILAAHPWKLKQRMVRPWVCQAFFMAVHLKFLLFQAYLLVPFSKGSSWKIFSVTFPAWEVRTPVG